MTSLLPFIISGIAIGAVYGLAGTGLVLTYKQSRASSVSSIRPIST